MRKANVLGLSMDWDAVRAILTAFLVTRVVIFLIVFVSLVAIPVGVGAWHGAPRNLLLDGLTRWDSRAYYTIVMNGYITPGVSPSHQLAVNFFPLYPLVTRILATIVPNVLLAGVLISNVAFLLALVYLYALARHEFGQEAGGRAVFYLAAAPGAIFFSAMLSESLFVLLVTATLYYARTARWGGAAIAGALASACRNPGIFLAVAIAVEGWQQRGVRLWPVARGVSLAVHVRRQAALLAQGWRSLVAAAVVPAGLVIYMLYLARAVGDPLAFVHTQSTLGHRNLAWTLAYLWHPGGSMRFIYNQLGIGPHVMAGHISAPDVINFLAVLGFGFIGVGVVLRMRLSYALFVILVFIVSFEGASLTSMNRYVLALVPCFVLLAKWGRHDWVDRLVAATFLPLMAYVAVTYAHWMQPF